jgi:cyanophycin synthetase
VGIVTNVTGDHLGLKGIHSIEQLARVKGVLPETVVKEGYAILNADDDLVFNMSKSVESNVALFSMDENNAHIKAMAAKGGLSAIYENGYITICKGEWKLRIIKAVNVPLTFGGKATFMIQNVLPAVLTAYVRGFSVEDIKVSLETFIPSHGQTPGRLNLFEFENFQVMIDYAHNPAGLKALQDMLGKMDAKIKVGIIAGVGDRRDEDTQEIGSIAAEIFDEIIIRQDKNLRGRKTTDIVKMLKKGIKEKYPNKKITHIASEKEAITSAIENAKPGSLIVLCSDMVAESLELVMKLKEKEVNKLYNL